MFVLKLDTILQVAASHLSGTTVPTILSATPPGAFCERLRRDSLVEDALTSHARTHARGRTRQKQQRPLTVGPKVVLQQSGVIKQEEGEERWNEAALRSLGNKKCSVRGRSPPVGSEGSSRMTKGSPASALFTQPLFSGLKGRIIPAWCRSRSPGPPAAVRHVTPARLFFLCSASFPVSALFWCVNQKMVMLRDHRLL